MALKIATWNVNSVRVREGAVRAWVEAHSPDVLCLQETKVVDEKFPRGSFASLGYAVETFGQPTYNGVAILSRLPLTEVTRGLPGDAADGPRRPIAATAGGIRIVNVYVPNGSTLDSDKFAFKLEWLQRLRRSIDSTPRESDLLVCGDFNVAPEARGVHDPAAWEDSVLFHPTARAALADVTAWGLTDAFRLHHAEEGLYSWWDYRLNAFKRRMGLRIDHILVSPPLALRCTNCEIDVEPRRQPQPSDHAPVIASFG